MRAYVQAFIFAISCCASAHAATIYKCETASGKIEFRDTPCVGGGGAAVEIKDTTPQQEAAARASLANTREQAAALTERLEARTRAANANAARAARYAPAPIVEQAPVAETIAYPFGYPCSWAGCGPGYYRAPPQRVTPPPPPRSPPPSVTIPPPIPANMRTR